MLPVQSLAFLPRLSLSLFSPSCQNKCLFILLGKTAVWRHQSTGWQKQSECVMRRTRQLVSTLCGTPHSAKQIKATKRKWTCWKVLWQSLICSLITFSHSSRYSTWTQSERVGGESAVVRLPLHSAEEVSERYLFPIEAHCSRRYPTTAWGMSLVERVLCLIVLRRLCRICW